MKKTLLALIASIALFGCQSEPQPTPEKLAVEAVYAVDSKICDGSRTIAEVASKADSVNLKGAPQDFTLAYKANVAAWKKFAELEKKMFATNMSKAGDDVKNFISDYTSNPSKASVNLQKAWPQFANEIGACVAEVAKTNSEYKSAGARVGAVYPSDWLK